MPILAVFTALMCLPQQAQAQSSCDVFHPLVFDYYAYYARYPDLQAAIGLNPAGLAQHWQSYGVYEGRMANNTFNAASYLARYPDLQAAFGGNLSAATSHFVNYGAAEGRNGAP